MKKSYVLLLIVGILFAGVQVSAQNYTQPATNLELKIDDQIYTINDYQKPTSNLKNKALETGWLSPVTNWQNKGAFFQSPSFLRMFPDTNLVQLFSNGTSGQTNWHLFGTVFQPTDPFYELQVEGGWLMNRYDEYTVDSIRFPYGYFREVDSAVINGVRSAVVDTVIVHYYQPEHLVTWTLNSTGERFCLPRNGSFDQNIVGPNHINFTDTLFLTSEAATPSNNEGQFTPGLVQLEIPAEFNQAGPNPQLNGSNMVAVSIVYKPGQEYELGDTLVSFNDNVEPTKKFNNFGTLLYFNEGSAVTQTEHLNNSFVTNGQVRYEAFGQFRGYLATLNFFGWASDFFWDADFKVTVDNPSSVPSIADDLGLKAYPNPAKMGDEIILKLEKNVSVNDVSITMVDLLGNVVANEFVSLGNNEYSLTTNNLAGGVYLINVNADNSASTVRVVIGQ